jgi:hypothetical protein
MRKAILFAGLVVALVTLAVFLPGSARSAAHGTNLPFKGYSTGHITVNLVTGELHGWGDPTPVTLLGLHTSDSVGYAIPNASGDFDVFANVTGTAANGDHLFGTLTNDLLVFTGGSGRFEGATGWATGGSQNVTNVVISPDGILSADTSGQVTGVLNLNKP